MSSRYLRGSEVRSGHGPQYHGMAGHTCFEIDLNGAHSLLVDAGTRPFDQFRSVVPVRAFPVLYATSMGPHLARPSFPRLYRSNEFDFFGHMSVALTIDEL